MTNVKQKKKMKPLTLLAVILLAVVLFFGIVLGGVIGYFRLPVSKYYRASEKAFVIPALNDDFVPQGFDFDREQNYFIFSGYQKDHSASPVFLTDKDGKLIKRVTLLNPDGSDYTGHGGGIAVGGNFLYVTGGEDCCLYVYSYLDFFDAKDGDKLTCLGKFSTKISDTDYIENAFVTVYDGKIITGEFYRAESYPTLDSHKLTTKAGDYNQALAVEYVLDSTSPLGISSTPIKAYSLPDQVQGLTISDNKVYLSTSWGLSFSHIYEYDFAKLSLEGNISVLGQNIPLYAMDSASLLNDYKIPPMSEEMVFVDGKLFVACESASNKYIFGKFTGGKWLYATDLKKISKIISNI